MVRYAPIVLFAYNRPVHTRRTVESLQRNEGAEYSDLYVYSDGPKHGGHVEAVAQTRTYLRGISGFKSISLIERERNMGLAASVITGVTEVLERYPGVIVMEDDMLSSTNFLAFMNAALTLYKRRQEIFSVTGYNYPLPIPSCYPYDAYLSHRGSSWGWGTWPDRWRKVDWEVSDFDSFRANPKQIARFARGGEDLPGMLKAQMEGQIDSWSIRFDYAHYKHNAFCLHPIRSKIQNIGFDGSGLHCDKSDDYVVELDSGERPFVLQSDLEPDPSILEIVAARFRTGLGIYPLLRRVKAILLRICRKMQKTAHLAKRSD